MATSQPSSETSVDETEECVVDNEADILVDDIAPLPDLPANETCLSDTFLRTRIALHAMRRKNPINSMNTMLHLVHSIII